MSRTGGWGFREKQKMGKQKAEIGGPGRARQAREGFWGGEAGQGGRGRPGRGVGAEAR
jgi:hypothetical protein